MALVHALVLRAPGANCDGETVFALEQAGAAADRVHINRLRENPGLLDPFQLLVIPGGFTYGDDVAAGRILAHQLRSFLADHLARFRDAGKLILGVCNGFQVLLKAGLLVAPETDGTVPATLAANANGRFQDVWVTLRAVAPNHCPFLTGYETDWAVPIAHGEGRFVCRDATSLHRLDRAGQLVLRYTRGNNDTTDRPFNPNGSQLDVAGVCDPTGRILGLMPHPERHVLPVQHPEWTRRGLRPCGDGLRLFQNAVWFFE